jgi:hypothetical protein
MDLLTTCFKNRNVPVTPGGAMELIQPLSPVGTTSHNPTPIRSLPPGHDAIIVGLYGHSNIIFWRHVDLRVVKIYSVAG